MCFRARDRQLTYFFSVLLGGVSLARAGRYEMTFDDMNEIPQMGFFSKSRVSFFEKKGGIVETSPTGQQSRAKLHKTTQLHTTHNYITSYYILNILHTYYILTYYILTYLHTYILTYLHNYILT